MYNVMKCSQDDAKCSMVQTASLCNNILWLIYICALAPLAMRKVLIDKTCQLKAHIRYWSLASGDPNICNLLQTDTGNKIFNMLNILLSVKIPGKLLTVTHGVLITCCFLAVPDLPSSSCGHCAQNFYGVVPNINSSDGWLKCVSI